MGVLKLTKGGWIGYLQPSGNLELEKIKKLNHYNTDCSGEVLGVAFFSKVRS